MKRYDLKYFQYSDEPYIGEHPSGDYALFSDAAAEIEATKQRWIDRLGLCVRHGYYDAEHCDGICPACQLEEQLATIKQETAREITVIVQDQCWWGVDALCRIIREKYLV